MTELENIKVILDYINTLDDYKKKPLSFTEWLESEKERLNKEYFNLSVTNADDKDIISQALIEMSNKYSVNKQFQVANKIDEVRKRFLETEKYVKTNLNLYIKVKLNDYGKKIHRDYWKDTYEAINHSYKLDIDEEGYSTFQIWDFMNIFGEYSCLGGKPFLETNNVLVERSKK